MGFFTVDSTEKRAPNVDTHANALDYTVIQGMNYTIDKHVRQQFTKFDCTTYKS